MNAPSTTRPGRTAPSGGRALPDVLAFMQVLWAVAHRLDATSKRMRRSVGVTGPQRLALRVIGLFPRVSPGDLAGILHVHPSTLTGVLQRLTDRGLVLRTADPHDRRRAVLDLTRKGARANAASAGTVEAAVARTLASAEGRDVAATARVLELLARHLDAEAALPPQAPRRPRPARGTPRSASA